MRRFYVTCMLSRMARVKYKWNTYFNNDVAAGHSEEPQFRNPNRNLGKSRLSLERINKSLHQIQCTLEWMISRETCWNGNFFHTFWNAGKNDKMCLKLLFNPTTNMLILLGFGFCIAEQWSNKDFWEQELTLKRGRFSIGNDPAGFWRRACSFNWGPWHKTSAIPS